MTNAKHIVFILLFASIVNFAFAQKMTDRYHGSYIDSNIIGDIYFAYFPLGNDAVLTEYINDQISPALRKNLYNFPFDESNKISIFITIDSAGNTSGIDGFFYPNNANKEPLNELAKIIKGIKWAPQFVVLSTRSYHSKTSKMISMTFYRNIRKKTITFTVSTNARNPTKER